MVSHNDWILSACQPHKVISLIEKSDKPS